MNRNTKTETIIIFGLGNPGQKYLLARHNVGFRTVDCISIAAKIPLYKMSHQAYWGKGQFAGSDVVLAKPMTYMNNSGLAVAALCGNFGVSPERILVVYDDMDLSLGTLRLRPQGGSGGHNGLKSIIYQLQTESFPRMRIGIGRSPSAEVANYVLESFSQAEEEVLSVTLNHAVKAAALFIEEGITAAMNRYNVNVKKNPLQAAEDMLK
ncbi:MAG: aminoacyl-tRNA hydrolase [Clostridium sp.]|nr:aminoacyl-tRNA hydrolase [Clostridium sp.]